MMNVRLLYTFGVCVVWTMYRGELQSLNDDIVVTQTIWCDEMMMMMMFE